MTTDRKYFKTMYDRITQEKDMHKRTELLQQLYIRIAYLREQQHSIARQLIYARKQLYNFLFTKNDYNSIWEFGPAHITLSDPNYTDSNLLFCMDKTRQMMTDLKGCAAIENPELTDGQKLSALSFIYRTLELLMDVPEDQRLLEWMTEYEYTPLWENEENA